MIRLQIIERPGSNLFQVLKRAMRQGDLRTFSLQRRGRQVVHERYPGWINWSYGKGVISCEILGPKKMGNEWQILSALAGRLAQRYAERVEAIHVQLAAPEKRRRRR